EMPPRNLAQLGVEVFCGDLRLAEKAEKRDESGIGDAEPLTQHFVAVQQFGRDGTAGLYAVDDVLEFGRGDPNRAAAAEGQRHIALRAIDDRTARSLRPHLLGQS